MNPKLKWQDEKGTILCEEAFDGEYRYQVFFNCDDWNPAHVAVIFKDGKEIDRFRSGNRNFGEKYCKQYCEQHVKEVNSFWYKVKKRLKK